MKKYIRVWLQLVNCAFSSYASNRIDSFTYFLGKCIRLGFFMLMIFSIFDFTNVFAGYGRYEILIFFLTFNLIDVLGQAFMRGSYMFRTYVRDGGFDYIISKPINPLFFVLTRWTDVLDFIFLIPIIVLIIFCVYMSGVTVTFLSVGLYVLLVMFGLAILTGFYIIAAAVTITQIENTHAVWLLRDSMSIGRFPPEIFSPKLKVVFTYVVPIFIIIAYPAKALLGHISPLWAVVAMVYSIIFVRMALWMWNRNLKHYSSASS